MTRRFLLLGVAALAIIGCRQRTIKIVMERTRNGEVIREADVAAVDDGNPSDVAEEELVEWEDLYGEAVENVEKRYSFARKFKGDLPQDMAFGPYKNSGKVITLASPLGTLTHYVERMPGPNEPYEILRHAEHAVDIIIQAMTAYFERVPELRENSTRRKKVKQFLDVDFRRDVMNLALMAGDLSVHAQRWQALGLQGLQLIEADKQRILLYLHERGYLEREELAQADGFDLIKSVWPRVLRKVGEAVGTKANKPLPEYLARLESGDEFQAVFDEGLQAIGVTKEEFEEIVAGVFGSGLDGLKIEVTWRSVPKPVLTNGLYDATKAQVTWTSEGVQQPAWPEVLYAIWADGDEDFQEDHFGVILPDSTIKDHNLWYARLGEEQAEEWRDFLRQLHGPEGLAERLSDFQFSESEPPQEVSAAPQKREPVEGAKVILSGLQELQKADSIDENPGSGHAE